MLRIDASQSVCGDLPLHLPRRLPAPAPAAASSSLRNNQSLADSPAAAVRTMRRDAEARHSHRLLPAIQRQEIVKSKVQRINFSYLPSYFLTNKFVHSVNKVHSRKTLACTSIIQETRYFLIIVFFFLKEGWGRGA